LVQAASQGRSPVHTAVTVLPADRSQPGTLSGQAVTLDINSPACTLPSPVPA